MADTRVRVRRRVEGNIILPPFLIELTAALEEKEEIDDNRDCDCGDSNVGEDV